MSARTKKGPAPAGSLSDAPAGAADRGPQGAPPTIESVRTAAAQAAKDWAGNTYGLSGTTPMSTWRRACRIEASDEYAALDNCAVLLDAWDIAFDEAAPVPGPALTIDEQRILTAYRTMDGRRQAETMRFMEGIAKEFPGTAPVAGSAALDGTAAGAGNVRAALDELRNHVGDESENLAILADTLRDLLWLATDALIKDGGERVDTLIRAAQRYVEDLDEIAKHLHKAEVAAKKGGAS